MSQLMCYWRARCQKRSFGDLRGSRTKIYSDFLLRIEEHGIWLDGAGIRSTLLTGRWSAKEHAVLGLAKPSETVNLMLQTCKRVQEFLFHPRSSGLSRGARNRSQVVRRSDCHPANYQFKAKRMADD
jgi:hypothetical protein